MDFINSFTIKELLDNRDGNFIHHDQHTKELQSPVLEYCYANTLKFKIKSSQFGKPTKAKNGVMGTNRTWYNVFVLFEDFYTIGKYKEIPFEDAIDYAINFGDVHIRCNCPAELYWGYRYMGTELKYLYGIPREDRYPVERNPGLKGTVCFVAGTKVWTKSGIKNIEDVKVGDMVFTHKGRLRRVTEISNRIASNMSVVKISKENITCTDNHPWYVSNKKGDFDFREIGKTPRSRNNVFATSPKLSFGGSYEPPKGYAFMLGLYLSDGNMHRRKVVNDAISDRYKNVCEKSGKKCGYPIVHGKSCNQLKISVNDDYKDVYEKMFSNYGLEITRYDCKENTKSAEFFINDIDLINFLVEYGNFTDTTTNDEKTISDKIYNWSDKAIKDFLAGYFWGDGALVCGSGDKSNPSLYATWYTTNQAMAEKLNLLIRTQYWTSGLHSYQRPSTYCVANGVRHIIKNPKRMYYIRITGTDVGKFLNEYPAISEIKGFTNKKRNISKYEHRFVDGYWLKPLLHKEYEKKTLVYNIGVEEDESYLVGEKGWAVHNCKHEDAVLQWILRNKDLIAKMFAKYYERLKDGQSIYAVNANGTTITIGSKNGDGDVFVERQEEEMEPEEEMVEENEETPAEESDNVVEGEEFDVEDPTAGGVDWEEPSEE